jgi:hypothetical protein
MRRLVLGIVCIALSCAAQEPVLTVTRSEAQAQSPDSAPSATSVLTLPAETNVVLTLTSPVWARKAKPGDSIYAQTDFPVAVDNQMVIPPGTYVEGQIDSLTHPGFLSPRAQIQIHFTRMIFANGYAVDLMGPQVVRTPQTPAAGSPIAQQNEVIPAIASIYVDVTSANDLLLDNGAQFQMVLQLPLQLDAASVADAARKARPMQYSPFKSATLCRPTPGTPGSPGTPDTVIPGSPGTPDTVIPGGPGMPDTVIPGIPATPATVIPGMPGTPDTPGTVCPGPPVVMANPKPSKYKEAFELSAPARVGGTQLAAGNYEINWTATSRMVNVEIEMNKKVVAKAPALMVILEGKSPADAAALRTGADGSPELDSLRFKGQDFALYFDQGRP